MVCVATEYGESLLPQGEYLELSHERLDEKQMEERMLQMENGLVIDATHPYAQVVTENIETACERTVTDYLRVVRQESRRLGISGKNQWKYSGYHREQRTVCLYGTDRLSGKNLCQSAFSGGSCLFLRKTWH